MRAVNLLGTLELFRILFLFTKINNIKENLFKTLPSTFIRNLVKKFIYFFHYKLKLLFIFIINYFLSLFKNKL